MDYFRFVWRAIDGLGGLIRCAVLAGALLAPAASVSATILSSVADNGDGTYTYSFAVDNSAGSFDIAAWSLEVGFVSPDWNPLEVISGGDVVVPDSNWIADTGIPVAGLFAQDFLSLDPSSDVLVGSVLSGFSFTSSYQPGVITYYEFSAFGDSATGSVIGPSTAPIPEPRGLWTFPIGLALVAFAVSRRPLREQITD